MIKGVGTDIVKLARIEKSVEKFGDAFARRILHQDEFAIYQSHVQPINYLAKRFAAKEALVKALGIGFREGICLSDVQVVNDAHGKPEIKLHNKAEAFMLKYKISTVHLSLSDEKDYALAFVVVE
ncbi:MAG: holo-ACP synthase [Legionellaceae bacterium]|nr:holo-ACP synthase [Legionellaceae bacterium]|tara:strand:+ start:242 stop:616 length:375 start_codon:yes stop_codon:yes gene_type:complete